MNNVQATPLTALCDAAIFTGESMAESHALLIKDGKIVDIVAQARIPPDAIKTSCPGQILAPGFIDAQVNGGGNILFNNDPTVGSCMAIAKAHRAFGTTRLLLTCITDRPEVTQKAIAATREAHIENKAILGLHIEGPHLGTERRGVHNPAHIRPMTPEDMRLYRRLGDEVMLMTLAPESVSPEQIGTLRRQGVIVSLGHTDASAAQIYAALEAGAIGFTHLFNGMGTMSARVPGPAGVALDDRTSWCSLIADEYHVSPEMIRLALRAKPKGKVFLVSDAMPPAAAGAPQPFKLYGETIRVEDKRCVNGEGRLAGSAITLLDAVQHCVRKIGVELDEALRMASTYPAAFLGVDNGLGKLLPNYEADVVALDRELNPTKVWVAGNDHVP